jgi:hypothetical protein
MTPEVTAVMAIAEPLIHAFASENRQVAWARATAPHRESAGRDARRRLMPTITLPLPPNVNLGGRGRGYRSPLARHVGAGDIPQSVIVPAALPAIITGPTSQPLLSSEYPLNSP